MINIALQIANEDPKGLDAWDTLCGELANAVLHQHDGDILYVTLDCDLEPHHWNYHMVPVIDGLVHDAWHPDQILPPDEYVKSIFDPCTVLEWELFTLRRPHDYDPRRDPRSHWSMGYEEGINHLRTGRQRGSSCPVRSADRGGSVQR